ncbi:MAG: hypothetical protein ACFFD1_14780 [Candidatus Thorarchaeota archaeon]
MENKSYQHPEAFCLMQYACEKCYNLEVLWNSRDGVTPFTVGCTICHGMMRHIRWEQDQFYPDFIPPVGTRVFYSCKNIHEIIQMIFDSYTEEIWNRIKNGWKDYCNDRYELIWNMALHCIIDDLKFENPHILIVTEDNQEKFISDNMKKLFHFKKQIYKLEKAEDLEKAKIMALEAEEEILKAGDSFRKYPENADEIKKRMIKQLKKFGRNTDV